jgi:hypothetical protein
MGHRHRLAARNLALSPVVGIGCALGGVALGTAIAIAGVGAGVTAPVWYTRDGWMKGKEQDELEAFLAVPPTKGKKGKKAAAVPSAAVGNKRASIRNQAAEVLRAGAAIADDSVVPILVPKELALFVKNNPEAVEKIKALITAQVATAHG